MEDKSKNIKKEKVKENNKKKYYINGLIWGLVLILGFSYYRIERNKKIPKTVFIRNIKNEEVLKDKVYIYYPEDNTLANMEVEVPKIESPSELLNKTVLEVTKKLEELKYIPEINMDEVSCYIFRDKVYLDVPKEMFMNIKNAKEELFVIYSFVNSLTNIDGVESVRIVVNHNDTGKVKYANLLKDYTYSNRI